MTLISSIDIQNYSHQSVLGGEEILIEYAGKEATETFDDIGHSQDAKDLMKKFHVGSIVEAERKPVKTKAKKEDTKK